jgi:hypothetical protein
MNRTFLCVAKRAIKSMSIPLLLVLIAPLSSANATMAKDSAQASKQGQPAKSAVVSNKPAKKATVSKKRPVAAKKSTRTSTAQSSATKPSTESSQHALPQNADSPVVASLIQPGTAGVVLKTSPALTAVVEHPVPLQENPWQYMPSSVISVPIVTATAVTVSDAHQATQQPVRVNPYLVNMPVPGQAVVAPQPAQQTAHLAATQSAPQSGIPAFSLPKFSLPDLSMPLFQEEMLPRITKVYPTGEKPLVVLSFKCPTEMVGLDLPATKLLRWGLEGGMDLTNKSNLLSFNMQSVCR